MKATATMFGVVAMILALAGVASANIILYSEDFESATLPTNILLAPFSWTNDFPTADVPITQGSSPLNATKVADGPALTGSGVSGKLVEATRAVPSPTAGLIYTFTADTYFLSGTSGSANGIGLGKASQAFNGSGVMFHTATAGLAFEISGIGGGTMQLATVLNAASKVTIVLDMVANTVEGRTWDATNGTLTTGALPIPTVAQALALNRVVIMERWNGFDFDNITYSVVPEPSTLALLGCGLAGLLCYAWRKRR